MNRIEEGKIELVIGYDLCKDYSQISYFQYEHGEPKTISIAAGEEKFQIPTVLFKKKDADKWYFGEEAVKKGVDQGTLVDDLLDKVSKKEMVDIDGEFYEPVYLLELFIRKSFTFLNYEEVASKKVDAIVFTVEEVNEAISDALIRCGQAIGILNHQIYIEDHEESFFEYTIHQKSELWTHDVVLLEYGTCLKASRLVINSHTTPITATVDREDFSQIKSKNSMFAQEDEKEKESKLDELVKESLKEYFGVSQVSCVFLCGEGFDGEWAKETLRYLCFKRRVFQGKNLYTKGACYSAAKRIRDKEQAVTNYLFLGKNKLKYNIGIDVFYRGEGQYHALLDADENWYDAKKECELILDEESSVELKLTPIDHKDTRIVIMNLHDLPNRPNRTIRVLLQVSFESVNKGTVLIKDLGFGDFYKSSGMEWMHEILL